MSHHATDYQDQVHNMINELDCELCEECGQDLSRHVIAPDPLGNAHLTCLDTDTHFCTYCDFYSRRSWDGKQVPLSTVFIGTLVQVVSHAETHPIGDPRDMALPVSERAPYVL